MIICSAWLVSWRSPFPYNIPKTGKTINSQEDLISDLTIALGLIEKGSTVDQKEKGAKIMLELMNCPIEEPADREFRAWRMCRG